MATGVLSRYLNPEVLSRVAHRHFQPRGMVMGNLAGAHKSPLHGFAVEFAGHREYVWGDDPKHVDWRLYYTREKLFIKQYEMETNFVCHLILDISASMRYGAENSQKLQYAAQMATTLGYGSALTSGKGLKSRAVRELFGLGPGEHAICFVSLGTPTRAPLERARPGVEAFTSSL